jgi:hypothetical protein
MDAKVTIVETDLGARWQIECQHRNQVHYYPNDKATALYWSRRSEYWCYACAVESENITQALFEEAR